jgi:hypothetical protein
LKSVFEPHTGYVSGLNNTDNVGCHEGMECIKIVLSLAINAIIIFYNCKHRCECCDSDEMIYGGAVCDSLQGLSSNDTDNVLNVLKESYNESRKKHMEQKRDNEFLKFPTVSATPCCEYRGTPIFSNAFPWLFPGGVGDLDENKLTIPGYAAKWLKTMILYFDGRFCKDPTFCFYALNFKQRHQNSSSGAFFITDFIHPYSTDLDSLKSNIESGKDDFLEKLLHYSSKIRGSPSYWKSQKFKVFSWANRLIELGKLPTLFISLSCAEHFWEDLKRLLIDRFKFIPENQRPSLQTKADITKAVKEYSIVVQEFFILKVKQWIETFGRDVFKIEHYFVRFEFAEGRGEIHAHIIASADNMDVYKRAYESRNDPEQRIKILEEYAENILGLSATHPATDAEGNIQLDRVVEPEGSLQSSVVYSASYCPASKRLTQITDVHDDLEKLVNAVQTHKCGNYCLKKRKDGKRYCRSGCGKEVSEGSAITPGFKLLHKACISREMNGTYKLNLKRNSSRMVQSSLFLTPLWRANNDVQLLLYDSDPTNPDLIEIGKVTDYIISYACKGNMKTEAEVQVLNSLVQRYDAIIDFYKCTNYNGNKCFI